MADTLVLCPGCGYQMPATTAPVVISTGVVRPAARKKLENIVLGIGIDRTGSSEQFASGILEMSRMLLNGIAALIPNVRVLVQSHGDLDFGEPILMVTDGTPTQAIDDISRVAYGGGGDREEHHLDALESIIAKAPWYCDKAQGRNVLILFATADSKPAKSGVTPEQLGQQLRDRNVLVYLVCEPNPTFETIARVAGGTVLPISVNPDQAQIDSIAHLLTASITCPQVVPGTLPLITPTTP